MKTKFILLGALTLVVYGIGSYYAGLRILQSFGTLPAQPFVICYWILFITVSLTYFLGRIGNIYFPGDLSDKMVWLGSYWLAILFYLCLFWLIIDALLFGAHILKIIPPGTTPYSLRLGISGLILAASIVGYGAWNARTPRVCHYQLKIDKKANRFRELHVVLVSDLHLGLLVGKDRLELMIEMINRLQPDLVLFPGDILDENIGAFVENQMPEIFHKLKSRLGLFGSLGSHEYVWGHSEKALECLANSGITILRDAAVNIADSFYLVGRDDLFREQLTDNPRKQLSLILQNCDRTLPIILLDHRPEQLEEGQLQGVDLQLSGHTHHGQIFPLNIITKKVFTLDYGYLQKNSYQLIVSSGYGTWGPPIRVCTSSEIVDIKIIFDQ
jgi:hypothetical protein